MASAALIAIVIAMVVQVSQAFRQTACAPGYDEAQFREIRVGMSEDKAEEVPGRPLETWSWPDGTAVWECTAKGALALGYRRRCLR